MNILIFGSGAVGLGLASCLLKVGVDTSLVAGRSTINALKTNGLYRTGIFGHFQAEPEAFSAFTDLKQIQSKIYDFVLVCTKSDQTQTAAENIFAHRNLLKPECKIVHFQNGWGNAEKFLHFFSQEVIYSGRVITGFTRTAPNHVDITVHADAVHIGSLFNQPLKAVEPLCQAIDNGGIPCRVWKDIDKDLWAKMLYNCALNPLGAILGVPYGALADNLHTREIMDRIIEEIYTVMDKYGFTTYWPTANEYKNIFYSKLVPPTAKHRSSTLQDLQSGKKTEIKDLTGQILELANKANVDVPMNTMIYHLIRFREEN